MTEVKVKWSHSALKKYEQCPRQYHEVVVLKLHPHKDTPQTLYGTQVHESLELYVRDGTPIPAPHAQFKPVVDALVSLPGHKMPELEMALDKDLRPVEWKSPDAWVRGISDLTIVDDDSATAYVSDYKTGSNKYPDRDQLVLMSLMTFRLFPHVQKVKSALLFLMKNDMVKMQMQHTQAEGFWWKYRERIARIEASHVSGVWNPKQSALCGWCPCTSCELHPKHHIR